MSIVRTRTRVVLIIALVVAGIAMLAVIIWALTQVWLLRTVGIPGPIDIGFGIP